MKPSLLLRLLLLAKFALDDPALRLHSLLGRVRLARTTIQLRDADHVLQTAAADECLNGKGYR